MEEFAKQKKEEAQIKEKKAKERLTAFVDVEKKKTEKTEELNKIIQEKNKTLLEIQELQNADETIRKRGFRVKDESDPSSYSKITSAKTGSKKMTQEIIFKALAEFKGDEAVELLKQDIKAFRKRKREELKKETGKETKIVIIKKPVETAKSKKDKVKEQKMKVIKKAMEKVKNPSEDKA
jgi:hypothetical protein